MNRNRMTRVLSIVALVATLIGLAGPAHAASVNSFVMARTLLRGLGLLAGGGNWQRIFDFGQNTNKNMFLTPRSGTIRCALRSRRGGRLQNSG